MCFLRFNKYKVKHMSSNKWTVLRKSGARLNKIIFSTKPSGPVWATLSQTLIFIIFITLIASWCLINGCDKNFSLF